MQFNYLPTLRAQLALNRHDPSKAIEALKVAAAYELGTPGNSEFSLDLYPVYVRGKALLTLHQGSEAAAEFQKILDWPGVVQSGPIGALAHLEIARAFAHAGNTDKSLAQYKEFLTLWKNADADLRPLKDAKAEYKKLSDGSSSPP